MGKVLNNIRKFKNWLIRLTNKNLDNIGETLEEILEFLKESSQASQKEKAGNIFLNFSILLFFSLLISYKDISETLHTILSLNTAYCNYTLIGFIFINLVYILFKFFTVTFPNAKSWYEKRIGIDELYFITNISLGISFVSVFLIMKYNPISTNKIIFLFIVFICVVGIILKYIFERYLKPKYLPFISSITNTNISIKPNESNTMRVYVTNNQKSNIRLKIKLSYDVNQINVIPIGIEKKRDNVYTSLLWKNQNKDISLEISGKNLGEGILDIELSYEYYKKIFSVSVEITAD